MSAKHSGMKAQIEEAYAPTEDDTFVETADEVANSGYSTCYWTDYDAVPVDQCKY